MQCLIAGAERILRFGFGGEVEKFAGRRLEVLGDPVGVDWEVRGS